MSQFSKKSIRKVLLLGSGGLRIGQAGEFDYSGSQAIKALKEEGLQVVLVNPNIATVQTDPGMADTLYLEPLNVSTVTKIIAREKPDGILLGFGGQTALNLGMALDEKGVLNKFGVQVLGTPVAAIRQTEDRELFKKLLASIAVKTPRSSAAHTVLQALQAAKKIGYPIMMRSGFSLGGLGSGKISSAAELNSKAQEALHNAPQILIEEYLAGWKEIEYEVVRDANDTALTVCNMENMDPMGIHTGESIVVAPSQTLTNAEYHLLREVSLTIARRVGIVGEGNIQFALNPKNGDYRVIEMNARLSRSSALASKATGYPLAFVAAKLALGYKLNEIKNSITKKTTACFEPALDYVVVKIPRWDLIKFKSASRHIGSEMKSVGEVMAIGRSFPEALQKAVRMLNIGVHGLSDYPGVGEKTLDEIEHPTDRRLFAIYQALRTGETVERIAQLSQIDPWFIHHINSIAQYEKIIKRHLLTPAVLKTAKQLGFSDHTIGSLKKISADKVRSIRLKHHITPVIKQIDTLAGEFPAQTNYLYTTYHGTEHDIAPSKKTIQQKNSPLKPNTSNLTPNSQSPILILGSGPYCIGSSVEFDWCAVNTARTLRHFNRSPIIINSNPETVSTDYDESDRLYFEELTLERIQDIADFEHPNGIVVSVGGQVANNVALPLAARGYNLLGTSAANIDCAEDRQKFSSLLNKLGIDQPTWEEVTTLPKAKQFAARVGYPVLVRPSYVLSGAAMQVVESDENLTAYLVQNSLISSDHPVVISQFIQNAKELEIDAVAKNGAIVIEAISEHVENAGVHSGDATIVLPPQYLYLETIRRAKRIARDIARALQISGPFNVQFIAKDNELKVIECNVRASRSFPFVSKVTGHNFIELATKVLLGESLPPQNYETLELDHVGVKTPQFSFQRVKGADPVTRVEMASTGEVACLGQTYVEAFFKSWLATDQNIGSKKILLSLPSYCQELLLDCLKKLEKQSYEFYATDTTYDFLWQNGLATNYTSNSSQQPESNAATLIKEKKVGLIINIPYESRIGHEDKNFKIRRLAIDHHIPLITNTHVANLVLRCLTEKNLTNNGTKSWQEYLKKYPSIN